MRLVYGFLGGCGSAQGGRFFHCRPATKGGSIRRSCLRVAPSQLCCMVAVRSGQLVSGHEDGSLAVWGSPSQAEAPTASVVALWRCGDGGG